MTMSKNPFVEQLRHEAYDECGKWRQRAEEISESDDYDLIEDDVEEIWKETFKRIRDGLEYGVDDRSESLPDLLSSLSSLEAEWRTLANSKYSRYRGRGEEGDFIREDIFTHMSMVAGDEAKKVQFIMEEYL